MAATVALTLLDLDVAGPTWAVILVAVLVGLLGTALGLALSAFARNEFQAVQFMPAVVFPQFLLCGLLAPREDMSPVLRAISDVLPLSYAVDAMGNITTQSGVSTDTWWALAIVTAFIVASVAAGALTLRRSARG